MSISSILFAGHKAAAGAHRQCHHAIDDDKGPSKRENLARKHLGPQIQVLRHQLIGKLSELVTAPVDDAIVINRLNFQTILDLGFPCEVEHSDAEAG